MIDWLIEDRKMKIIDQKQRVSIDQSTEQKELEKLKNLQRLKHACCHCALLYAPNGFNG